ncbi:VRR-NUC domain-containing protein [Roseovarius sp. M141]|uniref:VRR-NUC domain-containing protein n=1 Tax=Roseovarius sp. M141 TaxID=2583806 RepID=UPI0020CE662B|nr:VRR-NUC domain-containing protein [Roseovarius sp. M141]MCQ0094240.1 VRR-NUC domain-containing protein [Roseovarius sp. M141]
MSKRNQPEAEIQRAIVQALRLVLPRDAIVHHCANEVTEAGPRGARRQSILVGMGVHCGFADLIVLSGDACCSSRSKSRTGRLRKSQEVFRDAVLAQGFGWALVRSLDDALGALADHGFTSRVQLPARRASP